MRVSARPVHPRLAPPRLRVRWNIFLFLCAFSLINYLQHTSISIAGVPMMAELHLNEQQLAWLLDATQTLSQATLTGNFEAQIYYARPPRSARAK